MGSSTSSQFQPTNGIDPNTKPQIQPPNDKNTTELITNIEPTTTTPSTTKVSEVDVIYYTNLIKQQLNGLLDDANLNLVKADNVSISEKLVAASSNIGQVNATNLINTLNLKIVELNNQLALVSGQYSKPIRMLLSQLGVQYGEVVLTGLPTLLNDPNIRQNIVGAIIRILGKIRFGFYDDKMLVTLTAGTTQLILSQSDDTFLSFLGSVISS